jgi:hypothetical protein
MTWLTGPDPDAPLPPDSSAPLESPSVGPSESPGPRRSRRRRPGLIALGAIVLVGGGAAVAVSLGSDEEIDLASMTCDQLADRVVDDSDNKELVDAFRIRCGSTMPIGLASASQDGTITGSIAVGNEIASEHRTCYCSGASVGSGYGDIGEGTQVVVKDPTGKIIATGALDSGTWKKGDIFVACVHAFTVTEVPKADFYTLSIGRRGEQTYSHADLQQRGWRIDLTLG